jgi:uncharacterized glyoxalase superfamily protein PhnB
MADATCSCCGKTPEGFVRLDCHPEVVICDPCLDWLNMQRDGREVSRAHVRAFDPQFRVTNVQRAAAQYKRLGFRIEYHDETYAFAQRDELTIHLAQADDNPTGGGSIYLHVDDADRLAEEWRQNGAEVSPLTDTDYGKHEGTHIDPDGNIVRFGSPTQGT